MKIIATNEGKNFPTIEAGTYAARCYEMIQIGTVTENVMGKVKKLNKVRISWELPNEQREFKEGEGLKPFVISKEFTISMHEKASLRKFLEAWRGKAFTEEESKAFDITALIGKACMLSVFQKTSQSGKSYTEISGVSQLMKGISCPKQINPTSILSFDEFNFEKFKSLPEFIRKKIERSEEYKSLVNSHETTARETQGDPEIHGSQTSDFPF